MRRNIVDQDMCEKRRGRIADGAMILSRHNTSGDFSSSSSSLFHNAHEHHLRRQQIQIQQHQQQRCFATTTAKYENDKEAVAVVDFFKLFGLPRKFGVRMSDLKGRYLKLMTEYHPDKQMHINININNNNQQNNKEQDDDNNNNITAETITHAYQTLQSPHTRACHWLELHDCPLMEYDNRNNKNEDSVDNNNNNNNNDFAGANQLVGMEFLMDMMEWRERVEDATKHQQDKLKAISKETRVLQTECEESLERLLDVNVNVNVNVNDNVNGEGDGDEKDEEATFDEETLQEARKLTAQLQYWHRLERTLRDEMDIV